MSDRIPFSILNIKDDADARSNLVDIVEFDGYKISSAGTAAAARDRDNWSELFAIILERKLPDGTANELLPRTLRTRRPT